jgi:hypothetical protein
MIARFLGSVRVFLSESGLIGEESGLPIAAPAPELACGQVLDRGGGSRSSRLAREDFGQCAGGRPGPLVGLLHGLGEADIVIRISPATQFGDRYGHGRDS